MPNKLMKVTGLLYCRRVRHANKIHTLHRGTKTAKRWVSIQFRVLNFRLPTYQYSKMAFVKNTAFAKLN